MKTTLSRRRENKKIRDTVVCRTQKDENENNESTEFGKKSFVKSHDCDRKTWKTVTATKAVWSTVAVRSTVSPERRRRKARELVRKSNHVAFTYVRHPEISQNNVK